MKVVGGREKAEQKAIAGTVYSIKFPAGRGAPSLGLNTRLHYNKSHPTFQPFALSPPAPRPKKTALEFFLSPTRRHLLPALPFATSLLCAFPFAVPTCISQTLFHASSSLRRCSNTCTCSVPSATRLFLYPHSLLYQVCRTS